MANARDEDGDAYALAHADDPRLARLAVFDAVINNADRKGGHVLYPATGAIHGVDHGVSFHVENKLRTVLWGWTGKALVPEAVEVLTALGARLDADARRGAGGAPDDLRGAARAAAGAAAAARRPFPEAAAGLAGHPVAPDLGCLRRAVVGAAGSRT